MSAASEPRDRRRAGEAASKDACRGSGGEAPGSRLNSGLRESNPSDWLGKPGHYHYAKPARCPEILSQAYFALMNASTSSRFFSIISRVVASRLSRRSGSVFDGRTLKCQSGYSTETPSIVYDLPSA